MKIADIQVNADQERAGVWREYLDTGFECRLARAGNPDVIAERRRLDREYRQAKGLRPGDEIPEEDNATIGRKVAARCIVRDWRGLEEEDGTEIPYSPEKALEFLRDDRMRKWTEWVYRTANSDATYEQERERAIAGN